VRKPTRAHKFKIGQTLNLMRERRLGSGTGSLSCKIVQLLPLEQGEPQYRIRCTSETVERVAKESALVRRN
jgi:hypothetical protein